VKISEWQRAYARGLKFSNPDQTKYFRVANGSLPLQHLFK